MTDPSSASPSIKYYLPHAAWTGSVTAIRYFLQKQLKIEQVVDGRTPLLWAVSGGHIPAVQLLIQKGADITKKTADGDTALICAVWSGNIKMVRLMMDKGFDLNDRGSQGTALEWAEKLGHADIAALLKKPTLAASHARTAAQQQYLKDQARKGPKLKRPAP